MGEVDKHSQMKHRLFGMYLSICVKYVKSNRSHDFVVVDLYANDGESYELYQKMNKLERKWFIEEAREILRQDNIGDYKKKEWQRLNGICYSLSRYPDPEATELLERLKEFKLRASRKRS